jgi:hypothetical protein
MLRYVRRRAHAPQHAGRRLPPRARVVQSLTAPGGCGPARPGRGRAWRYAAQVAAVPLHRLPLAAHRLRGDREGPAEAMAIVRPRDGGRGTMTAPVSGRQPALGCITGHRKRSACARRPATLRRRRRVARGGCVKFACQSAPAPATPACPVRSTMMAHPGDACCAPAADPGGGHGGYVREKPIGRSRGSSSVRPAALGWKYSCVPLCVAAPFRPPVVPGQKACDSRRRSRVRSAPPSR